VPTSTPSRPTRPSATSGRASTPTRPRKDVPRRGRRRSPRSAKGTAITVGVVVLFAGLVYAAFGLNAGDAVPIEEVAGSPEVAGTELPPLAGDGTDAAVGQPAPVVTGNGFDGRAASIGEGTELVVFLASWCSYCQAELPELVDWLEAGELPSGVELTAVVTGLDPVAPNWPPQDWIAREGYRGDLIVDDADGSVARAYGMSGTPFWVAIDDGEVVHRAAGLQGMDTVGQLADQLAG
jgi:thiol-disulfide isomerase/thioredoxin